MSPLVTEIAELLYTEDSPYVPWKSALPEDRTYYVRVSEVIIDAVIEHLIVKDEDFVGGLRAAIEYLRTETDIARLRRADA
jgi:hypothetical protein